MQVQIKESWLSNAKRISDRRNAENGGNDAPAYQHNGRLPFTPEQASWFGVTAELAMCHLFDIDPSTIEWVIPRSEYKNKGLALNADLNVNRGGTNWKIEVRNAANGWSRLPIKEKDAQPNLIVIQTLVIPSSRNLDGSPKADAEPTRNVLVQGWQYGDKYRPEKAHNGCDYWSAKNDASTLFEAMAGVAHA